jgi:stress-induced morphogen
MAISQDNLSKALKEKFPDAEFEITDLAGDDNHYHLSITAKEFSGLTLLQQHRLVKDSLKDILHEDLHALSLKTNPKI